MVMENSYSPPRRVSKTQMGHHPVPTFRQTESFIFNTFMEKKREQAKGKNPTVNFDQNNAMINVEKLPEEDDSGYFYQDDQSPGGVSKPSIRKVVSDHEDFHDHSMHKFDNGLSNSKKNKLS